MLDIQAIIDRHLTDEKMQGKTFYEGHIVIDLYNAIEEIKELRAALTTMQGAYELGVDTGRAEADLLRPGLDATRAYADRVEAEVLYLRGERAAVVAWLREVLAEASLPLGVSQVFDAIVDAIERGEHLKKLLDSRK
jgi:hypothetical protein